MKTAEIFYRHTPPLFQKMGRFVHKRFRKEAWREGKISAWIDLLEETQWWPRERLEDYQLSRLRVLLEHAYRAVPYYRNIFRESGLKPNDIRDLDDLMKLPLLTRDDVQKNLEVLIARSIPRSAMEYKTTSGTSGKPLELYLDAGNALFRSAMDRRYWNWAGAGFGKMLVLRGRKIEGEINGAPAWWEYDHHCLLLSVYRMTEENLPRYVEKIREFMPTSIFAYASAVDKLARFINRNRLDVNEKGNLKAIITSSETLHRAQREMIEKAFRSSIFDLYGNVEETMRFGECDRHEGYHDFMEYGYTELLRDDGTPVTGEGEVGEIVSTGFTNFAMPFIRYRTGDMGEKTYRRCSCGRESPLIKRIAGRKIDFLVAKSGDLIPMIQMGSALTDVYRNVDLFKFYQDTPGKVVIKVVRREAYTEEDTGNIIDEMEERMGGAIDLEVRLVDEIPLSPRGKHTFIEQRIPLGSAGQGG